MDTDKKFPTERGCVEDQPQHIEIAAAGLRHSRAPKSASICGLKMNSKKIIVAEIRAMKSRGEEDCRAHSLRLSDGEAAG